MNNLTDVNEAVSPAIDERKTLAERYKTVRQFTEELCQPLEIEDYVIQSMPDASPVKWNIAHTSWFFEAFVLNDAAKNYKSPHPMYSFLFNSYYVQIGERHTRAFRGLISRPTVREIFDYRRYVDSAVIDFIKNSSEENFNKYAPVIEIGLNHEQQHQELMLTDLKHMFSVNPLKPEYTKSQSAKGSSSPEMKWIDFEGGLFETGHGGKGFAYDNETPMHKEYVNPFKLASRLVTNEEYIEFIEAGGYNKPELWLSDGLATVEQEKWDAPMYWEKVNNDWHVFTLSGMQKVNPVEPVCHVSLYEADAFARWKGARLPAEAEWEVAVSGLPAEGNFVEDGSYHPKPAEKDSSLTQMYGDVWEWTQSAYSPYPGYKPLPGALGEYNGKFMSSQIVLRGGSCATSKTHIRKTYRNFFPPHSRWQFMGIRLAKDVK